MFNDENIYLKSLAILMALSLLSACSTNNDWRTASRESAGIGPDPISNNEAVIHIYGADVWGWRGWFTIHTWVSAKHVASLNTPYMTLQAR